MRNVVVLVVVALMACSGSKGSSKSGSTSGGAGDAGADAGAPDLGYWLGTTELFGTFHADIPQDVALDNAGHLHVGGSTEDAFPGQTFLGSTEAFVAVEAGDSSMAWVHQFGGIGTDAAHRLLVDAQGNTVALADLSADGFLPQSVVVSLDPSGNTRWTHPFDRGPDGSAILRALAQGDDGRLYAAGTQSGYSVVIELDPATGAELWRFAGSSATEPQDQEVHHLAVDAHGDLLLAGRYLDNMLFAEKISRSGGAGWLSPGYGLTTPPSRALAQEPGGDVFIGTAQPNGADGSGLYVGRNATLSRLSGTDGHVVWTQPILPAGVTLAPNETSFINVAALARGADGTIYVTGSTIASATMAFEGGSQDGYDAYLAAYDSAGTLKWGKQLGSASNDYGTALTMRSNGDIAVVGYTFGDFGGASLYGISSAESCDVFIATFGPDGTRR